MSCFHDARYHHCYWALVRHRVSCGMLPATFLPFYITVLGKAAHSKAALKAFLGGLPISGLSSAKVGWRCSMPFSGPGPMRARGLDRAVS